MHRPYLPPGNTLLEAESTPGPYCDRKDFMSMKDPLTPAGIEPTTFRFLTQNLNHCATVVHAGTVHTVNSNIRSSNCQCSLLSKKNPIIRIFCMSGWLAVPINQDKWSSTVVGLFPWLLVGRLFV